MGKKLRNRELNTEQENESTTLDVVVPLTSVIGSSFLRKKVISRKFVRKALSEHKRSRFNKRLRNNEFSALLNRQMFECPICLDLIIFPTMMRCGHVYCYRCLDSNTAYSQRCCLCRQDQEAVVFIPIKIVENLIQKFILPFSSEYFRYLCRTTDSHEWRKHRTLTNPKLGLVVDFHSACGTWKKGVVSKLYENSVQIKTIVYNIPFYESVERKSPRLAPFTFFSRNRYLLDFPPSLPEFDNTQSALNNLEYKNVEEDDDIFDLGTKRYESEEGVIEEDEENMRIFRLQMQENDLTFNIE